MTKRTNINRRAPIPASLLRSLRQSYAEANQQAAALVNAYQNNPLALIDIQGEIERSIERANGIASRAQTKAGGVPR